MVKTMNKQGVARLLLLMMLSLVLFPFVGLRSAKANSPESTKPTTTESGGGDLSDIGVSLSEDGSSVSITGMTDGGGESTWNRIMAKYKTVILGVSGILTLTFIILFGKNIIKLAANSDNPQGRREAIQGCLWTFIAMALFGSLTVITGLAWNSLK